MKKSRILLYVLAAFAIASCTEANSQVKNLALDEFVSTYKNTKDAQLLDVRTPGEWENGKLNSSILINVNDSNFNENLNKIDKTKPVFVYCAAGVRSAKAAQILAKEGFKVFNLTNAGYGQLKTKGL